MAKNETIRVEVWHDTGHKPVRVFTGFGDCAEAERYAERLRKQAKDQGHGPGLKIRAKCSGLGRARRSCLGRCKRRRR